MELVGKGAGATTLAAAQLANRTLGFDSTAGSVMRDLTVELPYRTSGGFPTAFYLTRATARNVAVVPDPTAPVNTYGANAVLLNGGTLVGASVTLPMTGQFAAIGTTGPANTVRDSTIAASLPLNITADGATLSGLRITAGTGGAASIRAAGVTLADSTIAQAGQGPAVTTHTGNGVDAAITLDHDTLVGDGTAGSSALYASAGAVNAKSATITLRNSILRGFANSLLRAVTAGGGAANITTAYSDYTPTTHTIGSGGSGAFTEGPGNIDADPAFVSGSGDYRLTAGSPAIDTGDPAGLLGNKPGLDLAGLPRIAVGNAGCAVRTDMGAFGFQAADRCGPPPPPPPVPAADTTAPVLSRLAATPSRFRPARAGEADREARHHAALLAHERPPRSSSRSPARARATGRVASAAHTAAGPGARPRRRSPRWPSPAPPASTPWRSRAASAGTRCARAPTGSSRPPATPPATARRTPPRRASRSLAARLTTRPSRLAIVRARWRVAGLPGVPTVRTPPRANGVRRETAPPPQPAGRDGGSGGPARRLRGARAAPTRRRRGGRPTSPASDTKPAANANAVSISDFKFAPATLTVKAGAHVAVTNNDSTAHTATADDGRSFDTGTLDPDASQTFSVAKPGNYAYHCSIHRFMHGTLTVK